MLKRAPKRRAELAHRLSTLPQAELQVRCLAAAERHRTGGSPAATWEAYQSLKARKEAGASIDDVVVNGVVETIETFAANRVRWVGELAGLQNEPVAEVMGELGLTGD
jgi:hypothetical protein